MVAELGSRVTRLLLTANRIGDKGAVALAAGIAANGAAHHRLRAAGGHPNTAPNLNWAQVSAGLRSQPRAAVVGDQFRELFLQHNAVGDDGAAALAEAAIAHPRARVTRLMLSANHIGDRGALAVAAALQQRAVAVLRHWAARDPRARVRSPVASSRGGDVPELLSLHRLYLQGNNISDAAAAAVAAAIDAVLLPAETPTPF